MCFKSKMMIFIIWELGASRYDKNTPTRCPNIFHYREPHSENFSFSTFLGPLGAIGSEFGIELPYVS